MGAGAELITPHGDRKPVDGLGARVYRAPRLITPHGDRKRRRGRLGGAIEKNRRRSHYPSWGSKTPAPRGRAGDTLGTRTHYPSWGSKTRGAECGMDRARAHYPSWGSKTLELVGVTCRELPGLITPHGDRKRASAGTADTTALRLITPHGDRKHDRRGVPRGHRTGLITPHGDRKRLRPYPLATPSHSTHYPSWGSKTCARR